MGLAVSSLLAAACADLIGADFGDYRVGPSTSDAGAGGSAQPGSGGAPGGSSGSGGLPGSGGGASGGRGGQAGGGGTPGCVPRTCASVGSACGNVSDGCTGTISCGCLTGVCSGGTCCQPKTACAVGQCGTVSDGCTGTLECSACPTGCSNGVKDGTETAKDCGGPGCAPCAEGSACVLDRDCLTGSCIGNVCVTPPACTPTANPSEVCDGVDNDCDGTADNPGACPVNCIGGSYSGTEYMLCKTGRVWADAQADCVAHGMNLSVTDNGPEDTWVRQAAAANGVTEFWIGADDRAGEGSWRWLGGVRFWIGGATGAADSGRYTKWNTGEPNDANGGEDCGEVKGAGWNDGKCTNLFPYVCERFVVSAGCFDGITGGTETDVDCGGACGACPPGSACSQDTDCDTAHCASSVCVDGCMDKIKDGLETDIDCGGGTCAKCATGKACSANTDCTTGNCASGTCQAAVTCVASACPTCSSPAYPTKCCTTSNTCGCSLIGGFGACQ